MASAAAPAKFDVQGKPLWKLGAIDVASAATAAALVAPFVTVIDKTIFSNMSGRTPFWEGLRQGVLDLLRPHIFLRRPEFLFIYTVYTGTYISANLIETGCHRINRNPELPKFFGTSFANTTLSIWKDRALARMFGVVKPKASSGRYCFARSVAFSTYSLWISRDMLTIGAAFTVPPRLGAYLEQSTGWSRVAALNAAQLITPCAVQLLSTPLHLCALDLYNNPGRPVSELARLIQKEYVRNVFARMARILPAFGFGGITNRTVRESARDYAFPKTAAASALK